jgi:ArsR family transcriptional regulator
MKLPETNCVDRLKVLSDKTRLGVLQILLEGPQNVNELSQKLSIEQSLLSHHLQTLRKAALVNTSRDGKTVVYQLSDDVRLPDDSGLDLGCCKLSFDQLAL